MFPSRATKRSIAVILSVVCFSAVSATENAPGETDAHLAENSINEKTLETHVLALASDERAR